MLPQVLSPQPFVLPAPLKDRLLAGPTWLEEATPVQRAAFALHKMGFSVVPVKPASKDPYFWKKFTYCRIDVNFIPELFDNRAGVMVIAGSISRCLTILDADTVEAANYHQAQFAERKLSPWIVQSARGFHFWWLSADGELANICNGITDCELRGNNQYALAPFSVHPTGVIYDWVHDSISGSEPPALSLSQLDWLPLKLKKEIVRKPVYKKPEPVFDSSSKFTCLSKKNQEFLRFGSDTYRNNNLYALCCDLYANKFSENEIRGIAMDLAERLGFDRAETIKAESTVKSACSRHREPAKKETMSQTTRTNTLWSEALNWSGRYRWQTHTHKGRRVTADTLRRVFIACCERSKNEATSELFRASTREIGELAGMKRERASLGLRTLCELKILEKVQSKSSVSGANLYKFGELDKLLHYGSIIPNRTLTTGSLMQQKNPFPDIFSDTFSDSVPIDSQAIWLSQRKKTQDTFSRGALGGVAEWVWREILLRPSRPVKLAKQFNVTRSTVCRVLRRLEMFGLAQKIGVIWHGVAAGVDDLKRIAVVCSTVGRSERRREKHMQQRSRDVSRQLLKTKRRLEGLTRAEKREPEMELDVSDEPKCRCCNKILLGVSTKGRKRVFCDDRCRKVFSRKKKVVLA